ncbi:MAG: hypothetical protein K2N87_03335 [Eubacterium sp.]|nr:hypothetical protein [Eubacterium sp.]
MKRLICFMMSVIFGVLSVSATALAHASSIDSVQEQDEVEIYDQKLDRNVKIGIVETQQIRIGNEFIAVALGRA